MANELRTYNAGRQKVLVSALLCSLLLWTPIEPSVAAIQRGKRTQSTAHSEGWQRFLFAEIDGRAKLSKLENLQSIILPNDDLELRVWIGFGPAVLEGFVIERQSNHWSAMHLRSISPQVVRVDIPKKLATPESGWEAFWQRLTSEGVLTLPDSGPAFSFVDSEAFVVEIRTGRSYRTYMYDTHSETPEAKRMTRIVQTIREEFKVPR